MMKITTIADYRARMAGRPVLDEAIETRFCLKCDTCGREESQPYDEGDECLCGGKLTTAEVNDG